MTNTSTQGFIIFSDGTWAHLFQAIDGTVLVDTAEQEIAIRTQGGAYESLWKSNEGKVISRIGWQLADGSVCTTLKIYDAKNGVVVHWIGSERNVGGVSRADVYDINVSGLAIPVTRGMIIKGNTAD